MNIPHWFPYSGSTQNNSIWAISISNMKYWKIELSLVSELTLYLCFVLGKHLINFLTDAIAELEIRLILLLTKVLNLVCIFIITIGWNSSVSIIVLEYDLAGIFEILYTSLSYLLWSNSSKLNSFRALIFFNI